MTQLSNYTGPYSRSIRTAISRSFSDLDLILPLHPEKKDIIPLRDVDAVKQSVKNIILTNFGEKLFKPEFGGRVTEYLFENFDVFTAISIKTEIERILKKHEPRIENVVVQVFDNSDENAYIVNIGFKVINNPQETEIEFSLDRLR